MTDRQPRTRMTMSFRVRITISSAWYTNLHSSENYIILHNTNLHQGHIVHLAIFFQSAPSHSGRALLKVRHSKCYPSAGPLETACLVTVSSISRCNRNCKSWGRSFCLTSCLPSAYPQWLCRDDLLVSVAHISFLLLSAASWA